MDDDAIKIIRWRYIDGRWVGNEEHARTVRLLSAGGMTDVIEACVISAGESDNTLYRQE